MCSQAGVTGASLNFTNRKNEQLPKGKQRITLDCAVLSSANQTAGNWFHQIKRDCAQCPFYHLSWKNTFEKALRNNET